MVGLGKAPHSLLSSFLFNATLDKLKSPLGNDATITLEACQHVCVCVCVCACV